MQLIDLQIITQGFRLYFPSRLRKLVQFQLAVNNIKFDGPCGMHTTK